MMVWLLMVVLGSPKQLAGLSNPAILVGEQRAC